MRIHLIAIGGAAMHNIALALYYNHHTISGSDDEIYSPSRERLADKGLLPKEMGWFPDQITKDIDLIILGMHAHKDNPEIAKAKQLKIPIFSYPAFLYQQAKNKKRVVIAGSHGKTTTTAMIMHVLTVNKFNFDYLVGAQIEGFDTMVRLSDAPVMVMEGDEYLSSALDRRPKILHYKPHLSIITGIAWDHINVFPTFENYVDQFDQFLKTIPKNGQVYYYSGDPVLTKLVAKNKIKKSDPYQAFKAELKKNKTVLITADGQKIPLKIFGQHNLENLQAAYLVCRDLGISDAHFFKAIVSFKGAAKRQQTLRKTKTSIAYLDFAHAPSKVAATIKALKAQYPQRQLIACLELHTYSSLNKKFLKEYRGAMEAADRAFVYFNEHTLSMKRLPPIKANDIEKAFKHPNLKVFTDNQKLLNALKRYKWVDKNLLLMTSGTFSGLPLKKVAKDLLG